MKYNSFVKMGLFGGVLVFSMFIASNVFADRYGWEDSGLELDVANDSILSLAADEDCIYAGTNNSSQGAELWRRCSRTNWARFGLSRYGFGDSNNSSIECLAIFGDRIVAGTHQVYEPAFDTAAELWSSVTSWADWECIYDYTYSPNSEDSFSAMAVSSDFLFVGTSSTLGGAIFRISNTLDVEYLTGFPRNPGNTTIYALCYIGEGEEGSVLIAGTGNADTGAMISYSEDNGGTWTNVRADRLGGIDNISVRSLGLFDGYLYVGTHNNAGAEIWRTNDGETWESCCDNGFRNANNTMIKSLYEFNGFLYAGTRNVVQGAELWRSADGLTWEKFNENGFGDSTVTEINCLQGFQNRLYAGTTAIGSAGKLYSNDCLPNVISSATVTASSYHGPIGAYTYEPEKAMDGIYGAWDAYEWASNGEMTPWIRFNLGEARTINKIVLYDRCNPVDHIADAWLYLNRGGSTVSAIHLGMFPYGGAAKEVIFDPVTVDEIYIDIVDGWGLNVGLSEVQAYYDPTIESNGNLIPYACEVTASSNHGPIGEYTYEPINAMDGIYGAWDVHEWASDGEMDPWIRFRWCEDQTINKIVLYDRCNPVDHILDAWLYLNRDGSTVSAIHLGMFPYGGAAKEVIFDPVTVDEIYIDIVAGSGLNVGLSEVEAYYDPAVESNGNLLPYSCTVTASSNHGPIGAYTYEPENAMDRIYGAWDVYEWASDGEMTPWIEFRWCSDRTINKIVLYDRCNPVDHIFDAWLILERDEVTVQEIHLGMFPFGGAAKEVIFNPIRVDTIRITVTNGWGLNVGLSEVEAYYE